MLLRAVFLFMTAVVCCSVAAADESPEFPADKVRFFNEEVVPILKANCLKCHAGADAKGQLNLSQRDLILKGGDSGAAVDLQTPAKSVLLQAINYDGYEMPPTGQMSPKHIDVLTQWVTQGLPWPKDLHEIEFEAEAGPPQVNDETRQFWSYQPVRIPNVPEVDHPGHNPIDAFLRQKLQAAGLLPSPPASAQELVRRMHYDLLGLPPDPSVVKVWAEKMSDDDGTLNQAAVAEFIEQLLKSPHYGEQWGRHWLDLVRYAETNSYERDDAKPHVWRYRDYVIQSFNDDKPYDRFVTEQLAGDELPEPTPDSIIATGYYRLGRWDDEPADPKLAFYDDIDDIITTTSQTFLGMTVNCARCHDHKIDPVPQRDYYRMVAFFRNIKRYGVRSSESVLESSVREIDRQADATLHQQALQRYDDEVKDAERHLARIEKLIAADLQDVEKEEFQYEMNRVPIVARREGTILDERQVKQYRKQFERLQHLKANKPKGLGAALCVKEDITEFRPTYVLTRGSPHAEAEEVTPGFPSVLSPPEAVIPDVPEGAISSGRRRVLAEWIADPANPLTARVMVNRIWQYHFGRGIVRTSSDFGFQGTPPTHPELLDWLAAKFVESGWSVKSMHRLIMASAAYQMSSRPDEKSYAVDPVNDLFWRFDMRRLSAEEIRDSILWATGSLSANKMYGPSIYTDIPDAVKAGQSRPGSGWGKSSPEDENRRSIYIHVKRSLLDPMLENFDMADTDQTCPVRFVTVQPTQALSLMNSDFQQKQAETFARFLKQKRDSAEDRVSLALSRVMQRAPSDEDVQRGLTLMQTLKDNHRMNDDQTLKYFCLVALNLNEFMYLD
ncbi:MAG: PSD1 and planctomycete cytochrome C domain-containing protein [Planctomycetaceae bacterium]